MSKLKVLLGSSLVVGFAFYAWSIFSSMNSVKNQAASLDKIDASEIWGKANGPALVKIEEAEKTDTTVVLQGLIRSQLQELEVEWKLPEGAEILEGDSVTTVQQNPDGSYDSLQITVDISSVSGNEPIVFSAFINKNNERMGHTAIYKIHKSPEDQERIENVKKMMKARKADFVR
ncbi:MAG: hypothetical protein H6623_09550 [Bdellovibrionaceae bacterium]|nr:hypothetical protein [Pseudobdellovibrionaceae bacterium]